MKETITLQTIDKNGNEADLSFTYEDNVVSIFLNDKEICGTDYDCNFVFFLQKALRQWGFASDVAED